MVVLRGDGCVEFRFFRPTAANVFLSGDFNEWRTDQLGMLRQDDGHWVLRMTLPEGDYRFRYLADGQWYTDYAAFGVEPGRFGHNSVVRVSKQQQPAAAFEPTRPPVAAAA